MNYLILALATWRISSLLANEDGPYNIFERLRQWSGVHYDAYSNPQGSNELAKMLMCILCNSVWVGAALTVTYWLLGDVAIWLSLPFALSAVAVIGYEWTRGDL